MHIKKLVLEGFKSFADKTEIVFNDSMNVIVGPNGSGKSNIPDAICFVLGRLSMKSIRAAKSANLLFLGNEHKKPASQASVTLFLDNSDKKIPELKSEIKIQRTVRSSGQSIYKINEQTKTRQEVLELLAKAGIDPYGFNIVLQNSITDLIKMHPEERRQVIEEVSGISVYENRKKKSMRELERTDEKLNKILTVLRERRAYLKNLENERQQALKFQKLKKLIRQCKATILSRKLREKQKQLEKIKTKLEENSDKLEKERQKQLEKQKEIQEIEKQIEKINLFIQKSTGIQKDKLTAEVTELRANLSGLEVRKENLENRLDEITRRREELKKQLESGRQELKELRKKSPTSKKQEQLKQKKLELEQIEEQKNNLQISKTKLQTIREKIKDKEKQLHNVESESDYVLNQINEIETELEFQSQEEAEKSLLLTQKNLKTTLNEIENNSTETIKLEKSLAADESELNKLEKLLVDIKKLDICPLCKNKITEQHRKEVIENSKKRFNELKQKLEKNGKKKQGIEKETRNLKQKSEQEKKTIDKIKSQIMILKNIQEKKSTLKRLLSNQKAIAEELASLKTQEGNLRKNISGTEKIEENYSRLLSEIEEISARTDKNINMTISFKERELEQIEKAIKRTHRDEEELSEELEILESDIVEKTELLEAKQRQEEELNRKFNSLLGKKNAFQKQIHERNTELLQYQHNEKSIEQISNNLKVEQARIDAEYQALETDFEPFKKEKLLNLGIVELEDKLEKNQAIIARIGNVNFRALEVYESVKKQYDSIESKVNVLQNEKEEILKIIEEIDKKKKRTFMRTFRAINKLFMRNFEELTNKGKAFLELENKEDPFSAGLNIIIKFSQKKYFDVTSLSGGEQTLVSLSLIFAIQEYSPYCFYIFDEVDAALDKHNSERLASLIKKYMKSGQYIIVTHNDAIISEATVLYGVSMQEGISKITTIEV